LTLPEFKPENLRHERDLVMLATLPIDDDIADAGLCQLLQRSAKNQHRVFDQLDRLATVLGNAGTFITAPWEAADAARHVETIRSDLEARTEFLKRIEGDLRNSIDAFFQFPGTIGQTLGQG
jgi:hypothetical protein